LAHVDRARTAIFDAAASGYQRKHLAKALKTADADVKTDLNSFFRRLVPPSSDPSMGWVVHTTEGPDDMPAHIKAALTQVSISVPVSSGRLMLGTWQGIYLFEHRDHPHWREVVLHLSP